MTVFELAAVLFSLCSTSIYYSWRATYRYEERSVRVQREIESVFRELALKNGPKFIWASFLGSGIERIMIGRRIWQGVVELRAYGMTNGMVVSKLIAANILLRHFAERNSVIWRIDGK
jgi:hypothetical protein